MNNGLTDPATGPVSGAGIGPVGPHGLTLPPPLVAALLATLPTLADEVIAAVGREVPAYARPLEGDFGAGVRRGVSDALRRFLDLVSAAPDAPLEPSGLDIVRALGRGEARVGRSMDALLAAYRVGARVAWRRFAEVGTRTGIDPGDLVALAEAVFAYIDELSAVSAQGHAAEASAQAGDRERRREALARLLAGGGTSGQVDEAVTVAGWVAPATLAAAVLPAPGARSVAQAWDERSLVVPDDGDGTAVLLLPDVDGPGQRARLVRLLAGRAAVVGPPVPWQQVPASLALARRSAALSDVGVLPAGDPLLAEDHLALVVVHGDPAALAELRARRLAPLSGLPSATGSRLLATLSAWLDHDGDRQAVARTLAIHPQTVRYRVRQLRELLGEALDDPGARFELRLAVAGGPEP